MSTDSTPTRISPDLRELDPDALRRITESMPDEDPKKPMFLIILAVKLRLQFERDGSRMDDIHHISQALEACRRGVELIELSEDAPDKLALALQELARVSLARLKRLRNSADSRDIQETAVACRRLLELTPDDHLELPVINIIWKYAHFLADRFTVLDDLDTLHEASTWLRHAVELLPDARVEKPAALAALGGLLITRVERHLGNVDDIQEAIVMLIRALELAPCESHARPGYVNLLTCALSCQCKLHNLDDLGPLTQCRTAVEILSQERGHDAEVLTELALSFRARFEHLWLSDDYEHAIIYIDMAIELQRRMLEHDRPPAAGTTAMDWLVPPGSDSVDILASTLLLRLQCPHYVATISRHVSTVDLIPEEHPKKSLLLTALAECFRTRFESDRDPNDFVTSVTAARHALRLRPDTLGALRCLGCALVARFIFDNATSSATDYLDEAIPLLQRAVDGLSSDRHSLLALTSALSMRFQRLGDKAVSDIDSAIKQLQHRIAQLLDDHDDKPSYLAGLADAFRKRYLRSRAIHDLEEAIRARKRALDLLPSSSPRTRSQYLDDLGRLFKDRFEHLGNPEDSDRAVEAHREAASGSQPEPERVQRLAFVLLQRAMQPNGPESGFDEAVDLMRDVIDRAPLDAAVQMHLTVLGHALQLRFQRYGAVDDLKEAIEASERALSLAVGSGDKHGIAAASAPLSLCYFSRFGITDDASDLDEGIRLVRDAYDLLPSWLMTADTLKTFVRKLILRLAKHPDPQLDHLREARDQAQRAVVAGGGPSDVLEAALRFTSLVEWAGLLPDGERQALLDEVTEKYKVIIHRIPQVAWLGDDLDRRLERLSGYSDRNIVGAAVAHALGVNEITSALEWFEQGRAVVWTQINGLRTPVDKLRLQYPELASHLQHTAQALDNAGRGSASSRGLNPGRPSGASSVEAARHADDALRAALFEVGRTFESDELGPRTRHQGSADELRRLAVAYEQLLIEIRKNPGFEKFLLPRSRNDLSPAAAHSPVACINMHSSRCDALILLGSKLHHVPLPDLTPAVAGKWQEALSMSLGLDFGRNRESRPVRTASNNGLLRILRQMWDAVVQPIFAVLGWTDGGLAYERRIRWCTSGSLAFLPLHAAGPHNGSSLNASDIAVSSYTPTLAALLPEANGSGSAPPVQPSILMVAQPDAPQGSGLTPLPGAKQEFEHVQKHFSAMSSESTFLLGPEGTSTALLKNMSKHPYIHLACHGIQGVEDPMSSSFWLANGHLTLHELMDKSLRSGKLAFLSACETSKGHEQMPDEAVHLAAGMLAVGYRSVVGTMWSISDSAAPLVADEFYKALLDPTSPTVDGRPDVAYALHIATRSLRDEIIEGLKKKGRTPKDDEVAFSKWVPFVHFGL